MISSFLDKKITISVRQVLRWMRRLFYISIPLYFVLLFLNSWNLAMGEIGLKNSPYYLNFPIECREAVFRATAAGENVELKDKLLLRPKINRFSLPMTEEKLGFDMGGFPCMGWEFLAILHARDITRIKKFVDANGEVVAVMTLEIKKPYREPLPREEWNAKHLPGWEGTPAVPKQKDAGAAPYVKKIDQMTKEK